MRRSSRTRAHRHESAIRGTGIATALGLLCLVLVIGGLGLWAADSLLDLNDAAVNSLLSVLIIAAGVVLVVYLVRARKR
jgi:tellurite resistance protein TehA-like permease